MYIYVSIVNVKLIHIQIKKRKHFHMYSSIYWYSLRHINTIKTTNPTTPLLTPPLPHLLIAEVPASDLRIKERFPGGRLLAVECGIGRPLVAQLRQVDALVRLR